MKMVITRQRRRNDLNSIENIDDQSTSSLTEENEHADFDVLDLLPNHKEDFPKFKVYYLNKNQYSKYTLLYVSLLITFAIFLCRYVYFTQELPLCGTDQYHSTIYLKQLDLDTKIKELKSELLQLQLQADSNLIDKKIKDALNLYDADKIGLLDYAMESSGASISSIPDTVPFNSGSFANLMGIFSKFESDPRIILQPGILPGQCFAFKGPTGKIRVNLIQTVHITAITLEHVHQSLVIDVSSAPKDFRVYGLDNEKSMVKHDLGLYQYEILDNPIQTFQIKNKDNIAYKHVELCILTNHGNPDYTCIYRFRVHGKHINK